MCLITFAYKAHADYKLILAANRDEFYERPTRGAQFWTEEGHPGILAGKDLKAGGTWMGVNKVREWGALTNYRDPSWNRDDPPSRGELVLDFLRADASAGSYLRSLHSRGEKYMGFNILAGNADEIYHYTNHKGSVAKVRPGIHGLSNAVLNTPWPKLERAKNNLEAVISSNELSTESLFEMLRDSEPAPDEHLPDTGIPKEWEKAVSSVFIKTETYGTRCSTILMIDQNNRITFSERRYEPGTARTADENHFII